MVGNRAPDVLHAAAQRLEVGGDVLAIVGNGCSLSVPVGTIREEWSTGLSRVLG